MSGDRDAVNDNDRHKAAVRAFIEAINGQQWSVLDGLVAPAFVRRQAGSSDVVVGLAAFKEFLLRELQTFPDGHEEILGLVAEGDRMAAQLSFRGTQRGALGSLPASDRILEAEFACFFRFESGKIAEVFVVWDGLDMLRQLGHFHSSGGV